MFVTKREVSHTREVYPRHSIYAAFIVVYSPCTFIVCSSLLSHVVMRETDGNGVGRLMEATGAAAMLNNCFPLLRYHCMHTFNLLSILPMSGYGIMALPIMCWCYHRRNDGKYHSCVHGDWIL